MDFAALIKKWAVIKLGMAHPGWFDNGQPLYERNYKDGKLHGKCLGWYRNGQPDYEHNYKNGKLVSQKGER